MAWRAAAALRSSPPLPPRRTETACASVHPSIHPLRRVQRVPLVPRGGAFSSPRPRRPHSLKMDDHGDPARRHLSLQLGSGPQQQQPSTRSLTPLDLPSASGSSSQYRCLSPSLRPPAHPQVRLPSPYAQIPTPGAGGGGHHTRSLSQPLFFTLDSLPPPPPPPPYADLAAGTPVVPPASTSDAPQLGLPPQKAGHCRSHSDIPFGFSQLSPPPQPVKREAMTPPEGCRSDGDNAALYDLVSAYMDLDGLDQLNSSEDRHDDRDSRASASMHAGSAAESSENEAESKSTSAERKYGGKSQHCRSLSMDSFFGEAQLGRW